MDQKLIQVIAAIAQQQGIDLKEIGEEEFRSFALQVLNLFSLGNGGGEITNDADLQNVIADATAAVEQDPQKFAQTVYEGNLVAQEEQVAYAKWGAKLNYINYLRGNCPQGYEMRYFKKGGKLCKKCIAKQKADQKKAEKVKGNTIDDFKKGHKAAGKKVEKGKKGIDIDDDKELIEKFGPAIEDPEYRRYIMNGDAAGADSIAANRWNDQEIQTMYPGEYQGGQWTPDRNSEYYRSKNNRLHTYLMKRAINKAINTGSAGAAAAGAVGNSAAIDEEKKK